VAGESAFGRLLEAGIEVQLVVIDPGLTEDSTACRMTIFRGTVALDLSTWRRRGVARRALESASGVLRRQM
jgi:hypothetical protein